MAKKTECPHCMAQATKTLVTRYRKQLRVTKRYCLCLSCGHRFVTVEIPFLRYEQLLKVEAIYQAAKKLFTKEDT